jgi:hypothetical protein
MFDDLINTVGEAPFSIDLGGESTLIGVFVMIANIAIILAAAVSLIYLAYSFVSIAGSWGDEKLFKKSTDSLLWSVGAFVVAMSAWAILGIMRRLLGI